ncbi:phosphotransferase [Mesorhizobium sp. M1295]|uniref:phosphotransferase n=1 Tax=Mesorhizobium sp. M1295 TaxID=2957076 RepID=UPI0033382202
MPPDDQTPSISIDAALVRRLIAAQFPEWADLPVEPVEPGGWDNRTFRLGDRMSVRLPSAAAYVAQVEKEHRWLPRLAPHLPLPIPVPLARGAPGEGYPWPPRWPAFSLRRPDPSRAFGARRPHRQGNRRGGVGDRARLAMARAAGLGPWRRCLRQSARRRWQALRGRRFRQFGYRRSCL